MKSLRDEQTDRYSLMTSGAPYLLLLIWSVLVATNIVRLRPISGDEVGYLDPAINLATKGRFYSTAWWQPADQFFAANLPFHALISSGWFMLFGPGLAQGRLLSLALFFSGTVLILEALRRGKILTTPWQTVLFTLLWLYGLYSQSISQFARPEGLCLLILGIYFFAWTLKSRVACYLTVALCGVAAALTGLQLVAAFALYSLLAVGANIRKGLMVSSFLVLGGLLGTAVVIALYTWKDVLPVFLTSTFGLGANRAQWHGFRDPALWALTALGIFILFRFRGHLAPMVKKALFLGTIGSPLVAAGLFLLSKFPQYYCFFALLPIVIGISSATPLAWPHMRRIDKLATGGLLTAAAVGFPLYLVYFWNTYNQRDLSQVDRFCIEHVSQSSIIFCDPGVYFSAKPIARKVFTQFYLSKASEEDRASITTVILQSRNALPYIDEKAVRATLGGEWETRGVIDLETTQPPIFPSLGFLKRLSYLQPYNFTAWDIQHHR